MTLTFDLLTLTVVSESRVMWANSVPILVFLGLSVLELGPMYATDIRQTKASLNAPPRGGGIITSCAGGRYNMPHPCKLTFDLLTLKVVSESRVMWANSVPILVFLGLSVLDLGPYATERRQTASSLNAPAC